MTITIAHKIKTIINADKVFVLLNGEVKEQGRFNNLQISKKYTIDNLGNDIDDDS
jgi:ABC-type transport system involved in Fe-S cluster assembly fused permease/ATPase subunit